MAAISCTYPHSWRQPAPIHNHHHNGHNRRWRRQHRYTDLTQQHLGNLIHDRDGGAQLDPLLTGLVLSPQELADLATLLLITASRIDYGDPGWWPGLRFPWPAGRWAGRYVAV